MDLFKDELDLQNRLAILEVTGNYLSQQETQRLLETLCDCKQSALFKRLRDKLLPFVEPLSRTEAYALGVASLSAEIKSHIQYCDPHQVIDPSGIHIFSHNVKAFDEADQLNKRLLALLEMSWSCLYPDGSPTIITVTHPEISELLYDSALLLQNSSVTKSLAKNLYNACETIEQQVNFLDAIMKAFNDNEEMQAFTVELLISSDTNRILRLSAIEMLSELNPRFLNSFADNCVDNFTEILPEPYFDEHVIRFLGVVANRFSYDSARNVAKIADILEIDIGIDLGCEKKPTSNKPFLGIKNEYSRIGNDLRNRVKLLQEQILDKARGL